MTYSEKGQSRVPENLGRKGRCNWRSKMGPAPEGDIYLISTEGLSAPKRYD